MWVLFRRRHSLAMDASRDPAHVLSETMVAIHSESFGTGGDGDDFEVEGSEVNSVAAD